MKTNKGVLAVVLLAVLTVGACIGRIRKPEVHLAGLRLGGLGLRGGTVFAQLAIANPNNFALEAASISYDLELNDQRDGGRWIRLAQDRYQQAVRVEERDSTIVEIPIEFSYSGL